MCENVVTYCLQLVASVVTRSCETQLSCANKCKCMYIPLTCIRCSSMKATQLFDAALLHLALCKPKLVAGCVPGEGCLAQCECSGIRPAGSGRPERVWTVYSQPSVDQVRVFCICVALMQSLLGCLAVGITCVQCLSHLSSSTLTLVACHIDVTLLPMYGCT